MIIRSVIGRYWALYLVGLTVQCVVILAVLVRFFASTNDTAKWLLNSIYDSTVAPSGAVIFNFILDWAEALSITAVYIIIIPIFIAIMKTRRRQALTRINIWAMDAIQKLTSQSYLESAAKQMEDWEQRLHSIIEESDRVLEDTRALGNGLKPKVEEAVEHLMRLEAGFSNHTEPGQLKNLLLTTVIAFKEISTSTYQALNESR